MSIPVAGRACRYELPYTIFTMSTFIQISAIGIESTCADVGDPRYDDYRHCVSRKLVLHTYT